jgi:hypothetical protein
MTSPLTYVEFLSVFVAVPAAALALAVARRSADRRRVLAGVTALVCIAVAYTAPWDSYLIGRGVWTYGEGVVTARFARIPLGEWLFFGLQTILTGLWYHLLAPWIDPALPGRGESSETGRPRPRRPSARALGAGAWLAVAALGAALVVASPWTYYLGAILVWAGPVLAFLWAVGGPVLWRDRRTVAAAVAVPSLYLWAADRFAIGVGLWTISLDHSTGLLLAGLPVEEAVFFALTNLLVVQGLLLFDWVAARNAERGPAYAFAGLVPGGASERVPRPVARLARTTAALARTTAGRARSVAGRARTVAGRARSVAGRVPGLAEVRRRW